MTDKAYNAALVQIQKLANTSAQNIQKMVNSSNKLQMDYNAKEAKAARDWQTNMSKTAHQMEVADLKKAGLNPVLSANSGAQSYTTSSASTDNDSGASAASNVLGSQLGALSSMESSRLTSEAQKKAAATNAAAIKRAAETSAAAQRAAANAAASAQKYAADRHLEGVKTRAAADKWISTNKQASSLFGFLDKMSSKSGVQSGSIKLFKKAAKNFQSNLSFAVKNPEKYFSNKGKITSSNFKLNAKGQKVFNNMTKSLGLEANQSNRRLTVKAFVYQDQNAFKLLSSRMQQAKKQRLDQRASLAHHGSITPVTKSARR